MHLTVSESLAQELEALGYKPEISRAYRAGMHQLIPSKYKQVLIVYPDSKTVVRSVVPVTATGCHELSDINHIRELELLPREAWVHYLKVSP